MAFSYLLAEKLSWSARFSMKELAIVSNLRIISITKTYLYNFDPHKPHFCIVKLGFTGVNIIILIQF